MKWVTYQTDNGERTGVLSGDEIHAMPPGVTLLDLIGRGADGLRQAGDDALGSPSAVARLAEGTFVAPVPRTPSSRDSLCFLDHMRNCQAAMGAGRVLADAWYRIPAFYFACPATVLGPYDDAPMAPGSAWQDLELEIGAGIGRPGQDLRRREPPPPIGHAKGKDSGGRLGAYWVPPDDLEPYRHPSFPGKLS